MLSLQPQFIFPPSILFHCTDRSQFIYLHCCWWTINQFLIFHNYVLSEWSHWIVDKSIFNFIRCCQTSSPEKLYQFTPPSRLYKGSKGATSLPPPPFSQHWYNAYSLPVWRMWNGVSQPFSFASLPWPVRLNISLHFWPPRFPLLWIACW